jgi:hypothetical protein
MSTTERNAQQLRTMLRNCVPLCPPSRSPLVQHPDRTVDKMCRIAHGLCGLERGAGDQLLARLGNCGDAETRPNGRLVAVQRLRLAQLVGQDRRNDPVHLRSQIGRGVCVDFARRDEIGVTCRFDRNCTLAKRSMKSRMSTSLHSGIASRDRRFSLTFPCKTVFPNRPERQSGSGEDGVPVMLFLPFGFEQIGR